MRHYPLLALAAAVAASGCASSSGGGTAATARPMTQSIGVSGTSDRLAIAPSSGPNTNALDFPPDRIWRVLPAAFDSIAVPVARIDPASRVIGNEGYKIRQRLGRLPLSRYIDCGETQIGPNADSYEVILTFVVQVQAMGTGSRLVTTFEAVSRPLTFSQAYSRCTSRGTLEARFLAAVKAQLQ